MSTFNYPKSFAESLWLPFKKGSKIGLLIARAESIVREFTSDPTNWVSERGYQFKDSDMRDLWRMIVAQKKRVQAFWLMEHGFFTAYNPARESLMDCENWQPKNKPEKPEYPRSRPLKKNYDNNDTTKKRNPQPRNQRDHGAGSRPSAHRQTRR